MCGIVGLHLKNPDLQPRLGELLTMMLEAMTTQGPGLRRHRRLHRLRRPLRMQLSRTPAPRRASLPGAEPDLRYSLRSDTGTGLGASRQGARRGHRHPGQRAAAGPRRRGTPVPRRRGGVPLRGAAGRTGRHGGRLRAGHAGRQGRGRPGRHLRAVRHPGLERLPGHRPHPDGDGVGGDDRALAPVRPRRRPRAGPQRLVLELRDRPPPARPVGRPLRHRQRLRGRRPAGGHPHGARAAASTTRSGT